MGSSASSSLINNNNGKSHHGIGEFNDNDPHTNISLHTESTPQTKQTPLSNKNKESSTSFSAFLQKRVSPEKHPQQLKHYDDLHSLNVDDESESDQNNHISHHISHHPSHLKPICTKSKSSSTYLALESTSSDWRNHSPQRQRSNSIAPPQKQFSQTNKNVSSPVKTQSSKNENFAPKNVCKHHSKTKTSSLPKKQNNIVNQKDEDDPPISEVMDSFRKMKLITSKTNDSSSSSCSPNKELSFKYLLQKSNSQCEEFFIVVTPP
nr:unnamed protein product [Naegleria fowleri]